MANLMKTVNLAAFATGDARLASRSGATQSLPLARQARIRDVQFCLKPDNSCVWWPRTLLNLLVGNTLTMPTDLWQDTENVKDAYVLCQFTGTDGRVVLKAPMVGGGNANLAGVLRIKLSATGTLNGTFETSLMQRPFP